MSMCSIFRLDTGIFTGDRIGGEPEFVLRNTPNGCGAWPGEHDHRRVRVDLATQSLLAYQPPAPPDNAWHTWVWRVDESRWGREPTLLALRASKWAEIKAARDAANDQPLVTDHGTFDHDAASRAAILEMATGASVTGADVVATLADDTTVTLTPRQIAVVLALSHTRVQTHRATATALRAVIDAAGSPAAVAAISWATEAPNP